MTHLLIDNYDSFTYNIYHYLADIGEECIVKRNDEITLDEIKKLNPETIFISPGPSTPNEAGICLDLIKEFKGKIPIFGICLGHQAIAAEAGAKIIRADIPVHGKIWNITHNGTGCFKGLKNPLKVTRYHSLIVDKNTLPDDFEITSVTEDGIIMAIRHKSLPLEGVQFHPESIGSEQGHGILKNFINQYTNRV